MARVFLSHACEDQTWLKAELIEPIQRHGISFWYSKDSVPPGSDWHEQIRSGLRGCEWFLLALSHRSVNSAYVRAEVLLASTELGLQRIVVARFDDADPAACDIRLPLLQHVDFRADKRAALDSLVRLMAAPETKPPEPERGLRSGGRWLAPLAAFVLVGLVVALATRSSSPKTASSEAPGGPASGGASALGPPKSAGSIAEKIRSVLPLSQIRVDSLGSDRAAVRGVVAGPGELALLRARLEPFGAGAALEVTGDGAAISATERLIRKAVEGLGAGAVDVNARWARPGGSVTAVVVRFHAGEQGTPTRAQVTATASSFLLNQDLLSVEEGR